MNYEPGEKETSYAAKLIPDQISGNWSGVQVLGWHVYDFGVGRSKIDESKLNIERSPTGEVTYQDYDMMKQRFNTPLPAIRIRPKGCSNRQCKVLEDFNRPCEGGLLKPPRPRPPAVLLLGSTDNRGEMRRNFNLHLERAKSFKRFLKEKIDPNIARRTLIFKFYWRHYYRRDSLGWVFGDNTTPLGRSKNRSVFVFDLGGEKWTVKRQKRLAMTKFRPLVRRVRDSIQAGANLPSLGLISEPDKYRKMVVCICNKILKLPVKGKHLTKGDVYDDNFLTGKGVDYYHETVDIEWGNRETYDVHPAFKPVRPPKKSYFRHKRTLELKAYENIYAKNLREQIIDGIVCSRNMLDLTHFIDRQIYMMYYGVLHAHNKYHRIAQVGGSSSISLKRFVRYAERAFDNPRSKSILSCGKDLFGA